VCPVLPKHVKHVPKHRAEPKRPAAVDLLQTAPRKAVSTTLLVSSLAVAATGATVLGGVALGEGGADTAQAVDRTGGDTAGEAQVDVDWSVDEAAADEATGWPDATLAAAAPVERRAPTLSRSADRRDTADPLKAEALSAAPAGEADSGVQDLSDADPREIAQVLLPEFGFSSDQFGCLDSLYTRESNWNVYADNPTSSAYGIPQSLPGEKMASAGADWATNPVTQIRWGLGYIRDRYGSPCGAWAHSESHGWY
jgi:hypothetical protein